MATMWMSEDESLRHMGVDRLASIRLWTCNSLYTVVCSLMRDPGRNRDTIEPIKEFLALLTSALEALPEEYRYDGPAFRGEKSFPKPTSVSPRFHEKFSPTNPLEIFFFASFTETQQAVKDFTNQAGRRTLLQAKRAVGYRISRFSAYHHEMEVLVPPVSLWKVHTAMAIDENLVKLVHAAGVEEANLEGLHLVVMSQTGTMSLNGSTTIH